MTLTYLRKHHQSSADAYFKKCRHYTSSGYVPACDFPCKVCDGVKRLSSLLKFYALRDQPERPER